MPALKKTPAKKTAAKMPDEHWVLPVIRDALDAGEYWMVGQLAMSYNQYQVAYADGKSGVAARRFESMKELAQFHVSRVSYAAEKKKREALMARAREGTLSSDDLHAGLAKAAVSATRAREKALATWGIPA